MSTVDYTWLVPAGCTELTMTCGGAGGGGASGWHSCNPGGGGGGGGGGGKSTFPVTPGNNHLFRIANGGARGVYFGSGISGDDTTFFEIGFTTLACGRGGEGGLVGGTYGQGGGIWGGANVGNVATQNGGNGDGGTSTGCPDGEGFGGAGGNGALLAGGFGGAGGNDLTSGVDGGPGYVIFDFEWDGGSVSFTWQIAYQPGGGAIPPLGPGGNVKTRKSAFVM